MNNSTRLLKLTNSKLTFHVHGLNYFLKIKQKHVVLVRIVIESENLIFILYIKHECQLFYSILSERPSQRNFE